jgi:hypothetical protein
VKLEAVAPEFDFLEALQEQLEQASSSWWPTSWWRCRRVGKALKSVTETGKAPKRKELNSVLEKTRALWNEEQAVSAAGDDARALLGRYW